MPSQNNANRLRGYLVITLKSDLCAASGDGFSGGIDTDVCFDKAGFPFIPARRLKGCLREAAVLLFSEGETVDALFGKCGSSESGSIAISSAILYPPNDMRFSHEAREAIERQAVLDLFTYTRAQTAIEDSSAKDGSLRYTRVVKHYFPQELGGSELKFRASIDFDASLQTELEQACLATRNIGMNRNRGFGAVRCSLEIADEQANLKTEGPLYNERIDGDVLTFEYAVKLDSPIMLPQQNGDESIAYIPGSSVLGYFARSLKNSDLFPDLFLRSLVRFSPLYPVDNLGIRCTPASSLLVKLKGGKEDGTYLNAAEICSADGSTPKPLKGGFVGSNYLPIEVETEIVYHHRTGKDATLYTQECLCTNQVFSGSIEIPSQRLDLADAIRAVLDKGQFSFGRSKTAQYSKCSLAPICKDGTPSIVNIVEGEQYALLLDSDVALLDSNACYTTDYEDLFACLREAFSSNAWFASSDANDSDSERPITNLRYRTITGYNAKWNQKKPHIRVFEAGSCIVVKATETITKQPSVFYIGEKQAEGFGRVHIMPVAAVKPSKNEQENGCKTCADPVSELINAGETREKLRMQTIEFARSQKQLFGKSKSFNPSFIGRLGSMAQQASNRPDFDNRVKSIKSKGKLKDATQLITKFDKEMNIDLSWGLEQECLVLLFALGKYFAKQDLAKEAN